MKISVNRTLILAMTGLLFSGSLHAEKGLAYNPTGSVWRTSSGECWTTTYRDKATQESGCFGEPVVAVKEDQTEADSDGDGVVDSQDKCPNSAAGSKVGIDGCPLDSDGDGVVDGEDKCPDTAQGLKVDAMGCEVDSDGDGIADSQDSCPNTPPGATVTADGCAVKIVLQNIQFELNSHQISATYSQVIEKVAASLKSRSDIKALTVVGHTDSLGSAKYNQALSEKRAQAVADALAAEGIDQGMMTVKGMGESSPVADNESADGQAQNRRVELKLAN
ncbi:MAG: OmpA family protein [Candidatus Thiodiazotropha taylori]